jgi:ribonuclease P protein component
MARFRPREHIRRRADFEAAYAGGVKVSGRFMTMFVRAGGGEHARLGIAATRRIGGSVARNRARRVTRELFRHHKPAAAFDVVVVPRREFLDAPYPDLEREFVALLERGARALARGDSASARRSWRGRPRRAGADPRV